MSGYLHWGARHFSEVMYLDGRSWTQGERFWSLAVDELSEDPLIIKPSAAGTDVIQSRVHPIDNALRPDMRMRHVFQVGLVADYEEEFFSLLRVKAQSRAVNFVPYLWIEEHLTGASAADVYKLWRSQAYEVSPEATELLYPAKFFKNGVLDSDCLALSGTGDRTATIAEAGDIAIRYMPAFQVICTAFNASIVEGAVNKIDVSMTLTEVFD